METAEQKKYKEYVAQKAPKSRLLYDCFKAFWVGGLICVIGEAISMLFLNVFEMGSHNYVYKIWLHKSAQEPA